MRVVLKTASLALVVLSVACAARGQEQAAPSQPSGESHAPSSPADVAPPAATPPGPPAGVESTTPPVSVLPTPATNCQNPKALGVSRVLEVDPTGGPLFGSSDAKLNDFLRPGEIVLTFDDGPWKDRTPKVLAALARHCTKAIFFAIGKHTIWYPEVLQQVAAAGHTIGWHTWSHKNMAKLTFEEGKTEIELGLAAVRDVIGDAVVPFFRFPQLRRPEEIEAYLKQRNVAIWAADIDSMDYRLRNSKKVIKTVMKQLEERGKGIILMHDFQEATADGIDTLLDELQTHGYKVVEVRAKGTIKSLPDYDAMLQANTDFQCSRAGREGKPASALTCD